MSDRGYRRPRPLSPLREHLRDTFWFAPTAGFVCVFVLWLAASELDDTIVALFQREGAYDRLADLIAFSQDTKTVVTAISSAMMTFIGVVFSISLVAVQMASGQLTPRVVRIFVRSRISKLTLTVFLATFLVSLLVLSSYESETDPRRVVSVPLVQSLLILLLVGASLLLFVVYVSATLRLMQVGPVVDRITRDSLRVLGRMPSGPDGEDDPGPETARVLYEGRSGVLRDVNTARLVRAARRQGVVLRLVPRIGDFVVPGTPVLAVHGGAAPPRRRLRSAVSVSTERTLHQDLAFGLRQLVDIALRALSTSVNDPTTAVQCLDRIVSLLAAVARLPLGTVHHRDRGGRVRLVQEGPGWDELVDLAFEEIRWCVAGSPQVTRRLMAGLDDLLRIVPGERGAALLRHRALLVGTVERTVPVAADRAFALRPDRQGIG
ncbi:MULTISPECIES: DUF2254 domain-containing protein [Streptomyces]|uniref:DUF2254 domain-containing protein n=1 Tax=Streptomyces violaceoruber TaxID=1935 RepID=A0A1V0UJF2_STRVN|nr:MULTISPECIES: DUF2254 domain-containing protein [Streptomyces]MYW78466.1 DUF2254 domain-containing protein [Streptomyces sp. SID8369]NEA12132.1 DUF2254 domain-containing protein [Streptomyces sp. SID10692]NEC44905.1 DUF2254 domain-containing protein [Streptomyces sp. SID8016]ARF65301.1 hypothetical protein B1H20_30725 [Streptomyces violaceoruber]KOG79328.1 hypothetical protein ADK33_23625 [Streptomyces griseus subsp. rhodochrous]